MSALKAVVLLIRFLLELAALAAVAYWGWHVSLGPVRYVAAIVAPIAFATAWGLFASPKATFKPPGLSGQLLVEVVLFGVAAAALFLAGRPGLGWAFVAAVVVHRVVMLLLGMHRGDMPVETG